MKRLHAAPRERTAFILFLRLLVIGLVPLVPLASHGHPKLAPQTSAPTSDVVGGSAVSTCNWPTTIGLGTRFGECTGTLIHPRVVTTAAHCTPDATGQKISFGEAGTPAFTVTATKCVNSFQFATRDDWAYCILPDDDRLKKLPILPPLVGCEASRFLKAGAKVWVVGFGVTGSDKNDEGTKRAVETTIVEVGTGPGDMGIFGGEGTITVGDGMHGGCLGDSGGPVFMHLQEGGKDWGFRAVGITSGAATSANCEGPGWWGLISRVVQRIEKDENIDVTPCTNAAGDWDPGPTCKGFPTDPGNAGGTWPACNPGSTTSEPIASCGASTADAGGSAPPDGSMGDADGDGSADGPGDAANPAKDAGYGSSDGAGRGGSINAGGTAGFAGQAGGGGMQMGTAGRPGSVDGGLAAGSGGAGASRARYSGETGCSCSLEKSTRRSAMPMGFVLALIAWRYRSRRRRLSSRTRFVALGAFVWALALGCSGDGPVRGDARKSGSSGGGGAATSGAGGSIAGGGAGSTPGGIITSDAGQIVDDANCGKVVQATDRIVTDVFIMQDRSGSMICSASDDACKEGTNTTPPTRWDATSQALNDFVKSPLARDIGIGIGFFPLLPDFSGIIQGGPDLCSPAAYEKPAVAIAPVPGNATAISAAIAMKSPLGGTPTTVALMGAINYAKSYATAQKGGRKAAVLLVTDGTPTDCDFQQPGQPPPPTNTIDTAAEAARAGFTGTPSIKTFVVGMGDTASLSKVALAGSGDAQDYIPTSGDVAGALTRVLTQITGSITCNYVIPPNSDPRLVNVQITVGAGGTPIEIGKVDDAGACGAKGGWHYDQNPPNKPSVIILCPQSCNTINTTPDSRIQVLYGCPSNPPR